MVSVPSTLPSPIRILIADDHPLFRDGLRRLLQAEPGFEVVGEASDGDVLVDLARKTKPDILLLDLSRCHARTAWKCCGSSPLRGFRCGPCC